MYIKTHSTFKKTYICEKCIKYKYKQTFKIHIEIHNE